MSRRIAEGTLEAGKLADLVVLDKDPLKDIRHTNTIRYVMKNGELYEGNTLDQIWPKQGIGISNALEERLLVVVPEVLQDIAEHSPAVRQRDVPEIGA